MTSTHTSLAAARAPARSPLAALLQIPSTLAFTFAESVGTLWIIDLQIATYSVTPAALAALGAVVGDVDVVAALVAAVEVVAGLEVVVELLVVELLLPHPATSAALSSATASNGDRLPIICPPLD